jgi:CYTH domain-containing protein
MKTTNKANFFITRLFIFTAFALGFSVVLNIWMGSEYIRLFNEYQSIHQPQKGSGNQGAEIERKWLVGRSKIPYDLEKEADKFEITQTYLNYSPEIRVRNISNKQYIMAIKTGLTEEKGLTRDEHQYKLTKEEYEHLLSKQEGDTIYKTRYQIKVDNYTYSFDFFHEQLDGLSYMEIEFPTEEEANDFQAPDWLGKDVTNDKDYKNQSLAKNGIPASFEEDSKE